MIDENAYGLLISYFGIENDEYAFEREEFSERLEKFCGSWQACLRELPLGDSVLAIDLGHALYLEVAEDELSRDPLAWLREVRARLKASEFETAGVLSYGGRWLASENASAGTERLQIGQVLVQQVSRASEPLRHTLDADAATRAGEEESDNGWGPGLYVEDEAIEALGRKLKNAPTALEAGGVTFYRIAR
jgi:hypothetical protein